MERVDKVNIQKYSERNTSPKMPLEKKFVNAFIDALMNSSKLQEISENIRKKVQNDDQFLIFNSYWPTARNINSEPYRSILAYAMLKKDFKLFELISNSLFTGYVQEYHGSNLYSDVVKFTDEIPFHYTDEKTYTDMSEGEVQIGFKNIYSESVLEDGTGSEWQSWQEYQEALIKFSAIITMTKPARCQVLIFHVPYCFIGGDELSVKTINIKDDDYFESPFGPDKAGGDNKSIEILRAMPVAQLLSCYNSATMHNLETGAAKSIEMDRNVTRVDDGFVFHYEFRTQESHTVWDEITIPVGASSNVLYVESSEFDATKVFYEGYEPILLRLNDNDPDGPVLAIDSTHTIASMFYTRYKAKEE